MIIKRNVYTVRVFILILTITGGIRLPWGQHTYRNNVPSLKTFEPI